MKKTPNTNLIKPEKKREGIFTPSARRMALFLALLMIFQTAFVSIASAEDNHVSETEYICGLEEHKHDENCYARVLTCKLPTAEDATEATEASEAASTEASEAASTEASEAASTEASEAASTEASEAASTEATEAAHVHTDECYQTVLICDKVEHTHTDECLPKPDYFCGLEEHTHTAECYNRTLICGLDEDTPENPTGHTHTEECYQTTLICDKAEHIHTADCEKKKPEITEQITNLKNSLEHLIIKNAFGETIYDYSPDVIENPVFFYEESYSFALTFRMPEIVFPAVTYKYEIPAGLKITGNDNGMLFSQGDEQLIGSYQIISGENPHIAVVFTDDAAAGSFAFGVNFTADFVKADETDAYAGASEEASNTQGGGIMSLFRVVPVTDTSALENFVTGVIVKDSSGKTITDGNFFKESDYTFSITFAEREIVNGQFIYDGEGFLTYQLPTELNAIAASGDIKLPNNQTIGTYTIDTSGLVKVKFDNKDNEGLPIDKNFIYKYANVVFRLDLHAKFGEIETPSDVKFSTNAKITVTTLVTPPANLEIKKTASVYNSANETIDYTITIKAFGNDITNFVLKDALKVGSFVVKDETGNYPLPFEQVQYKLDNGSWTNTSAEYDGTEKLWKISGSGFPTTLTKDQTLQVKYSVKFEKILNYFANTASTPANGIPTSFQRLMYALNVDNTATALGMDVDKEVKVSASTATVIKKEFLKKTGTLNSARTEIEWTVTVGDGKIPLNGLTVKDSIQGTNHKITLPVTVTFYSAVNGQIGTSLVLNNANSFSSFSDTGFQYVIPSDPANIFFVKFVYKTVRANIVGDDTDFTKGTYKNDVTFDYPGDKPNTTTGTVTGSGKPSNVSVTKTSQWVLNDNGEPTGLRYTSKITIGAGNEGKNIYLDDFCSFTIGLIDYQPNLVIKNGNEYINSCKDFTIELSPPYATGDLRDSEIDANMLSPLEYQIYPRTNNHFYICFKYRTTDQALSVVAADAGLTLPTNIWPYKTEKTITVSYTLQLDVATVTLNGKTMTLLEGLKSDKSTWLHNDMHAKGDIPDTSGRAEDAYPIIKTGIQNAKDPAVFDYTIYLNYRSGAYQNNQSDIDWIFSKGSPAMFVDEFDSDKLEYVKGSFYAFSQGYSGYWRAPISFTGGTLTPNNATGTFTGETRTEKVIIAGNKLTVDLSDTIYLNKDQWTGSSLTTPIGYYWNGNGNGWEYDHTKKEVHYQLKLKDGLADGYGEPILLGNKATVSITNPHYGGDFSNSTTVTYNPPKPITKEMIIGGKTGTDLDKGNLAKVEIIVNPLGQKLLPAESNLTYFTATDAMTGPLAYYLNTIKIEYKNSPSDVNWTTATTVPYDAAHPEILWSIKAKDDKTIEFVLPDNKPIKITYDVLITAPFSNDEINFGNTITIEGYSAWAGRTKFKVQESSAAADASQKTLSILKEDEDSHARLNGAEFTIYMAQVDASTGEPYNETYKPEVNDKIVIIGANDKEYHFYKIAVSQEVDATGEYKFPEINGNNVEFINNGKDKIYLVVETKAPTNGGYNIPTNPDTFIVLSNKAEQVRWAGLLQKDVKLVPDNIRITNKSNMASVVIGGRKTVQATGDFAGTKQFTFELTQVENAAGTALTTEGNRVLTGTLYAYASVTKDNLYDTFEFDKITGLQRGNTYYFKVTEIDNSTSGWIYDHNVNIVTVTVDENGNVTATYTDTEGHQSNGAITAVGDAISKDKVIQFEYDKSISYQVKNPSYADMGQTNVMTISDGTRSINVFCANAGMPNPTANDTVSLKSERGNTQLESGLLYGAYYQLGWDGFNDFFGMNLKGITDVKLRLNFLKAAIWAYETKNLNSNFPIATPSGSWDSYSQSGVYNMSGVHMHIGQYVGETDTYASFKNLVANMTRIMQQYNGQLSGGVRQTSLMMTYTPTNATTGKIEFKHIGYVTKIGEAEQYSAKLSWNNNNVTVTQDGNTITNGGTVVKGKDIIVTNPNEEPVTFTLSDNSNYLKSGSVKSVLLKTSATGKQDIMLGYAEFITLKCDLTLNAPNAPAVRVEFLNKYSDATPAKATIGGTKQVTGDVTGDNTFKFHLTQVDAGGNEIFAGMGDYLGITGTAAEATVTVTDAGSQTFQFPEIPGLTRGKTYYFKVTEDTTNTPSGWNYDKSVFDVKISVDNAGVVTTEISKGGTVINGDDASPITFINTYGTHEKFPETGGIGRTATTALGIGLILMSALMFVFYRRTAISRSAKARR